MAGGSGPQQLQQIGQGQANAVQLAKNAGFSGLGLVTIVSIDRSSGGYTMTQSDYNAAWLKTGGGKNFTSYGSQFQGWPDYTGTNCSSSPPFLAFALPIANVAGIALPNQWNSLAGCSQNQNIPGGQLINNGTDALAGFDIQRIVTGLFGGILLIIGLMMFIKQISGVSITGVPGKVGKVLAL